MKGTALITFLLGPALINSTSQTSVNHQDGLDVAKVLNNFRAGALGNSALPPPTGSRYVKYNFDMQAKIDTWFDKEIVPGSGLTNGDLCWQPGDFCTTMLQQDDFQNDVANGWAWKLLDSTENRPNPVSGIFQYRVKQKACLDYSLCDANIFTGYTTCLKPIVNPRQVCRNVLNYIPKMLDPGFSEIACKLTGQRGPGFASRQPNSFFCLFKTLDKKGNPDFSDHFINDKLYKAANTADEICSECPTDAQKCYTNLCIDEIPPTFAPTKYPTRQPTKRPTSKAPTNYPTRKPTAKPTTDAPTKYPTSKPSKPTLNKRTFAPTV